jgi:hypothetical protein
MARGYVAQRSMSRHETSANTGIVQLNADQGERSPLKLLCRSRATIENGADSLRGGEVRGVDDPLERVEMLGDVRVQLQADVQVPERGSGPLLDPLAEHGRLGEEREHADFDPAVQLSELGQGTARTCLH